VAGQQTRGSRTRFVEDGGRGTKSDIADMRRRAGQRDAPLQRAFDAGRRGDDPAEFQTSDELAGYYQDGQRAAKAERRAELPGKVAGSKPVAKATDLAGEGAGVLLGLFAYALLVSYLQSGTAGVRAWLSAKFLNRPTGDAAVPRKPSAPAKPGSPG
jgi:hypothetical protein